MFVPIIAEPGTSRRNRTGSWRIIHKPHFLQENCIACKRCLLICPEGCIEGDEKNTYQCDFDYCKGCGNCAAVCPKDDIKMVPEETEL